MPSLPVARIVLREAVTLSRVPRVPEPDLVMDDPEKVAAYTRAGREISVMAPLYLYHCAQVCEIVKHGDTVVDLGCGPATQLAMIARLHPESQFLGVDFSDEMLERAQAYVADLGLANIRFQKGDMTDLGFLTDHSIDVAISTMSLHHLPDFDSLRRAISEVARVLRPHGGLYLADFGRLKAQKSIENFAYQYADRQPELFTLDYLYSLNAAFTRDDFRQVVHDCLAGRAKVYSTFIVPFLVAVKSPPRAKIDRDLVRYLSTVREALPAHHRLDLKGITLAFDIGGLRSKALS